MWIIWKNGIYGGTNGRSKSKIKTIFSSLNVNEKYVIFTEYENERKSKYKLLMPHLTISTNENKFIVKIKHFDKLSEIQIVSLQSKVYLKNW